MLNLRNESIGEAVYIGRSMRDKHGSPLANPFKTNEHTVEAHEEVVAKYRAWLWAQIEAREPKVMAELRRLKFKAQQGKLELACWCTPLPCHGDVILKCVEWAMRENFDF